MNNFEKLPPELIHKILEHTPQVLPLRLVCTGMKDYVSYAMKEREIIIKKYQDFEKVEKLFPNSKIRLICTPDSVRNEIYKLRYIMISVWGIMVFVPYILFWFLFSI